MNHVTLYGNLVRDPELRYTSGGKAICTFTVALNEGRDKEGNDREATFVRCQCWERQGETIAKYFSKGSPILLEGRLKSSKWETESGEKRSSLDVTVSRFEFTRGLDRGEGMNRAERDTVQASDSDMPF